MHLLSSRSLLALAFVMGFLPFYANLSAQEQTGDIPLPDLPGEVITALRDAQVALSVPDLAQAREHLNKAMAVAGDDERVLSLHGALLTYERNFDEARAVYLKLLQKQPDNFAPMWNLAEIDFLEGNYASSRQRFQKLQEDRPRDEFLIYKITLTYLFENKLEQAQQELDKIPFPSDTAAYYWGRGAIQLHLGNKAEGMRWLNEAGQIFRLQQTLLFADSLIEKGMITRADVSGLVEIPANQSNQVQ
ncbi:MAG: tetratricopeptide repeat protein [Verrucomicrobiia bacterium]